MTTASWSLFVRCASLALICSAAAVAAPRGNDHGGLFVVGPDGGALTRIEPSSRSDLTWGAAGGELAFSDRGWIGLWRGGRVRRVSRGDNPAWSADGRWLVFTRPRAGASAGNALFLSRVRAGVRVGHARALSDGSADVQDPSFGPHGEIVYTERHVRGSRVVVVRSSGGPPVAVFGNAAAGILSPRPSGAREVAYVSRGALWTARAGRQPRRLPGASGEVQRIAFSPDGRRIAFTAMAGGRGRVEELWVGSTTGGRARRYPMPFPVYAFAWAPRGPTLALCDFNVLELLNVTSGRKRELLRSDNPCYDIAWAPAARLAFMTEPLASEGFEHGAPLARRTTVRRLAATASGHVMPRPDERRPSLWGGPPGAVEP